MSKVRRKLSDIYNWKKKYDGLGTAELRRLRELEEENSRLKQIVADLTLDEQMLQDVLIKSSKARSEKAVGKWFVGGRPGIGVKGLLGRNAVLDDISLHRPKSDDRAFAQRIREIDRRDSSAV